MNFKKYLDREIEALKKDKKDRAKDKFTLDDLIDRLDDYPSIRRRAEMVVWSVERGIDKVREFPNAVKHFVHRGRHGWASPDTWSMDYALAKQLDGVFREFVNVSSKLIDYEEDNTDKIALEIADGFRAYWQHQERDWSPDFKAEDIQERLQADRDAFDEAHAKLKRSCELMAEHWPRFWW